MRISDWSSDVCSSDLLVHRFTGRAAGRGHPGNGHRGIAVIAVELLRAGRPFNLGEGSEGDHFTCRVANLERQHVLWSHPVLRGGLQEHPPDAAITTEVVGVGAAECDGEGAVDVTT